MSLKNIYEPYFKIGTSVSGKNLSSLKAKRELKKHYSSITAENEMKPMFMLDWKANIENPEKYNKQPALHFDKAKKYLKFAQTSGIALRGHTLIWHNQTPLWFFKVDYKTDQDAPLADRDTMLARMEGYIKGVLHFVQTEYPGVIYAWDVVNEAIEEEEDEGWRKKSLWYQTIGEDFVLWAFRFARKYVAEGVSLFYNDYNTFDPFKREKICDLILKPLLSEKLVDGMGMQSHLILMQSDLAEYKKSLECFGSMGLEVQITELDIHATDPSGEGMKELAVMYADLFRILLKAKKEGRTNITNVTFWGMKDDESWLTGFRKERSYPMLFGEHYELKEAYHRVIEVPDTL